MAWLAIAALGTLLSLTVPATRAEAQRGIPVNVESVPPGATVYLDTPDGAPLGTTPLTAVRVPAGAHTLIFRMPNFEEARLTVTVRRRRETFRAVLRPLGTIEVSAGNEGARGAQVRIDGQVVGGGTLGSLPIRVESLQPGRHQVEISREGYNNFEQWVEVQGGQVVRVTAMLERAAPTTGSILVSADIQGAPIFLDGQPRGATTTVLDDVPAGMHQIEIRPEGEDVQPFSQQVLVQAGQRATVSATLRRAQTAPTTGSIAVITDAPNAEVRINGQPLPLGTFSRDGLAPGNYVVQVIAEGHQAFRREVTVTAGQTTSVDAQLARELGPPGRINIVVANVSGARVTVDGEERSAPFVVNQPEAGTHAVVVRADGYEEVSFTCSTAPGAPPGDSCDRTINMAPLAVALRVTLQEEIEGVAVLTVDGREIGQVPYEGRVPVGDHTFEVSAEGYEPFRRQMLVSYGEGAITIDAHLRDSSEEAAAEGTTHSALPIAMNHPMIDASIGWPYLAELRLSIGLHELFDAGFGIRTFGRITEFEGRLRFGGRVLRQLAFGVQTRFGGGIGPSSSVGTPDYSEFDGDPTMAGDQPLPNELHQEYRPGVPGEARWDYPVNTAFFSVEGLMSLLLEPIAAVTLWLGMDITSDEYAASARNSSAYADFNSEGGPICVTDGTELHCDRQDMARFRLGGAVDFVLSANFNIWFIFEGVLAQTSDHRRMLSGFIGDALDIRIYPRLGITYKF
ncbi:PEGA domain-containing protein [Sandaracinus amylolyticus]|uniref:PEGA domain-containing protein n=1 Tax=Sandaracinus amylolyticus TaxID=927083 RepID=UPI001F3FA561|nr:PEGA domain-containing protein [Sandaracinus amylolyticus]